MRYKFLVFGFSLSAAVLAGCSFDAERPSARPMEVVENEFANPPMSARPRVWWHWMNGNVTKDGIAKDLEWMHRVGIGGLQNFDANLLTPQIVEERLVFMDPKWKDAFRFAAEKADKLGLEFAIAASPGWSETGGPWVQAHNGMKKLVWTETFIEGGKDVRVELPKPAYQSGPFQDLQVKKSGLLGNDHIKIPDYYGDVGVYAYQVPAAERMPQPSQILIDGEVISSEPLLDDSYSSGVELDLASLTKSPVIRIEYKEAQTVRSMSMFIKDIAGMFGDAKFIPSLSYSEDGSTWNAITQVNLSSVPSTVSFAPVTAKYFKVTLKENAKRDFAAFEPAPGADSRLIAAMVKAPGTLHIGDLRLYSHAKIDHYEAKAGFTVVQDYFALEGNQQVDATAIPVGGVVDLTTKLNRDGVLDWRAPEGQWKIIRLGWSLTGRTNHPATPEATGLEVDKYDRDAVRDYLETYLSMYKDAAGENLVGKHGVGAILTDSVEMGASNWTPGLWKTFEALRGYDPRPFIPTLTGAVVGSRAVSDKFLFDFRRTLADLLSTEHYGTVAKVAHENDMKVYGEALESLRVVLGDDMDMRRYADYPMAALWTHSREKGPSPAYLLDMKGASSVANVYGQNIAAAESMTSALQPWAHAPSDLRRIIDLEFAYGINRPVIHTSVHQPLDDKQPGLSLLIFGQFFNRHETWAEMARPWVDYMARNSYMLQQGRFAADVAYFYGEERPIISQRVDDSLADLPKHYGFDFVSAQAVLSELEVDGGELVTKGGARYKVLFLGSATDRMTLSVLQRIAKLAEKGATIVGKAPVASPSLTGDSAEFSALVARLWSGAAATPIGRGRIIDSSNVEQALASIGVAPDFKLQDAGDSQVMFVHRTLKDGDIYFVNNRLNRPEQLTARFRVSGKVPELWRADTATQEAVSYRMDGEQTLVSLDMAPEDSFFIVFREPTTQTSRVIEKPKLTELVKLTGGWDVAFQDGRGAPKTAAFPALKSLAEHKSDGIKYFSGVASYSKRFSLPEGFKPGDRLVLDLGDVADLAEVTVNGKKVGSVWHAPWQIDIGSAVVEGENTLKVDVANLWVNRLIGDAQKGADKVTFTTFPTYSADAPLRKAGLIGPVRLLGER